MKKSFLLIMTAALSLNAFGQSGKSVVFTELGRGVVGTPVSNGKAITNDHLSPYTPLNRDADAPNAKKTATMDRWYSYFDIVNTLKSNAMVTYSPTTTTLTNVSVMWMWFDSTIQQRFSTGYGTINFSSAGGVLYPTYVNFQDTANVLIPYYSAFSPSGTADGTSQLMAVTATDNYQVDSIYLWGAYSKNKPSRHTPDTLIVSVVPTNRIDTFGQSLNSWVSYYTSDTAVYATRPRPTDSVMHCAVSPSTTYPGTTFKVILNPDSTGDSVYSGGYFLRSRRYGFSPVTIPAGYGVAVSVTFKSSDTWTATDSVEGHNDFRPAFGYESVGSYSTYWYGQYYNNGTADLNGTNLMFSTFGNYKRYDDVLEIEGFNNRKPLGFNYLWWGAHLICNTCNTIAGTTHTGVNVKNVNNVILGSSVYPNPANDQLIVSFTLSSASDVHVSLSNAVGQIVANSTVSNAKVGKATFNTASLAQGVYFYTIEANGQRTVGRAVVAH